MKKIIGVFIFSFLLVSCGSKPATFDKNTYEKLTYSLQQESKKYKKSAYLLTKDLNWKEARIMALEIGEEKLELKIDSIQKAYDNIGFDLEDTLEAIKEKLSKDEYFLDNDTSGVAQKTLFIVEDLPKYAKSIKRDINDFLDSDTVRNIDYIKYILRRNKEKKIEQKLGNLQQLRDGYLNASFEKRILDSKFKTEWLKKCNQFKVSRYDSSCDIEELNHIIYKKYYKKFSIDKAVKEKAQIFCKKYSKNYNVTTDHHGVIHSPGRHKCHAVWNLK